MKKFFSKFLVIAMLFTLTIPSNIAFALGGDPETITLNDSNYNPGETVTVTLLDNADDPVELPADWDLQFQAREGVTEVLVENFLLGGDITLNGENYEFVIDEDILNSFPSATHDYFVVVKDDADEEVTVEEFNISAPAGRRNVFGNLNVPEVVVQIPNPQYLLFDEDREENQNFTFTPGENLGVRLESNLGTFIESLPQNWKIETSNYNEVTGRKVTLGRYEGFEISRIVAPQNLDEYEISLYNSRGSLVHDRSFLVTNGQEPTTITLNKRVFLPGEDILANILLENGELSKNLPAGFTVELNKINGAERRNLITYNNRLNDYLDNLVPGQYQYRLIHNDEELSVTSFSIESGESFRIMNVFNRNNPGDGIARVSVNPGQSFGIKLMDSELGMYHSWLPENYSILAEKTDLIANNVDERTLLIDTPGFIDNVSAALEPGVYKMILLNEETQTTISSNNLLYVEEEVIYTPAYLLFAGEINNPNFAANFPSVNGSVFLYFKIEDSNGTIHDAAPTREYEIEIYRTSQDGEEILMDNSIVTGNGYINDLTGDIVAPAALLEPGEYVAVLKNLSTNQRSITRSFRIFERNQRINLENVNLGEEIASAAKEFNENRKNVVEKISNQENLEFFFQAEESNTCSDMDPNDWSYELVLNAIEMNIWPLREDAEGNIICQPHNGLTRGMAALLLVSYYYPETADQVGQINLQMELGFLEMPFADVDLKNPLSSWIVASHGLGIFKGSPNLGGKPFFRPNDVINRAEFLALISRLNGFEDLNANDEGFNDINEDDWFNKSAKVGKALGLVKGYEGNNFKPEKGVSNAEAAKILQAASILSNGLKGKKIFETKDEKGAKEVVQEAVAEELLKFGRNIEDVKKAKVPDALVTGFLDEFQNGFSDRLKALGVDEEISNKSGLGKGKKTLNDYLDASRRS